MDLPLVTRLSIVKGELSSSARTYGDSNQLSVSQLAAILRQIADELEPK